MSCTSSSRTRHPLLLSNMVDKSLLSTFLVRATWTFAMIGGFVLIILSGHLWSVALVAFLEVLAFREIISVTRDDNDGIPGLWTRNISWYFLISTMFYLEGDALLKFFKNVGIPFWVLERTASYHAILSYILFAMGFMFFVITLKPGYLKQQYAQLCVTFMALLLIVVQGHFVGENVLHGLFWFLIPASLVIINDICAYLCGITMGRTPLIAISPKKTVEGFIGAWICTMIFSVLVTHFSASSSYMICPMERIDVTAFSDYTCTPNSVFVPRDWHIPYVGLLNKYIHQFAPTITLKDVWVFPSIYLHSLVLATYASLVAPFGGFFASGLKRAFKIKDFGDTIPGHGGVIDRFDCQFLMGFFAYLYYTAFVATPTGVSTQYLKRLVESLPSGEKEVLLRELLEG